MAGSTNATKVVRQEQSLELRLQGHSYRAIATALKVNVRTAYNDVQSALDDLEDLSAKKAERIRDLDLLRLDRMMSALATRCRSGDSFAIATVLRIMERRAKMLGLDAPPANSRLTVAPGTTGGPEMTFTLSFEKHPESDASED